MVTQLPRKRQRFMVDSVVGRHLEIGRDGRRCCFCLMWRENCPVAAHDWGEGGDGECTSESENYKPIQVGKSVQRHRSRDGRGRGGWMRHLTYWMEKLSLSGEIQRDFTVVRGDWHQNSGPLRQQGWWHWGGGAGWVVLWGSIHLTWLQTSPSELMLSKAFKASADKLMFLELIMRWLLAWAVPWSGCGCVWLLRAGESEALAQSDVSALPAGKLGDINATPRTWPKLQCSWWLGWTLRDFTFISSRRDLNGRNSRGFQQTGLSCSSHQWLLWKHSPLVGCPLSANKVALYCIISGGGVKGYRRSC